jgi:transposase
MNYCGIDVAMKSSYLYITDGQGHLKGKGEVPTTAEGLRRVLKRHVPGGLKVALEAGPQTAWIHDVLVALGADVTVVNPNKVRLIAESRRKTDKIDAKLLCELLRLDGLPHPVHVPDKETRSLRGLLVARRQLVSGRTKICNVVRGMLRQEGVNLPGRFLTSLAAWDRLGAMEFQHSHLKPIVAAYATAFKALTDSIHKLDKELAAREKADGRAAKLKTMPKVGRIAALTFLGAVDQVERFSSSRKLVGYSGLAPTVRSSGERTEYGSISREGRRELRAVWVQIAQLVAMDTGKATAVLRKWFAKVAFRRGKKTAIVALARKLLSIAYQILKQGTEYDASRLRRAA